MTSGAWILTLISMTPFCAAAQQAGVPTEWDIQKLAEGIAARSARVLPLVEQIHPREWTAKGAPDTYIQQSDSARSQIQSLKISTDNLAREPGRLTAALDA